MTDAETVAVRTAHLVLVLLVVDLGLGLALERAGYPGAMATATAIAGALFALTAVCGLALVALDVAGGSRQTSLGEWENSGKRH